MTTPEARARQNIDAQLTACGWTIQDRPADQTRQSQAGALPAEYEENYH
jgi:hypothetical protein